MDVLETLDSLQFAAQEDIKKKQIKSSHPEYHFDKLRMYFGEDYTINGITISIPTIGDILNIGEQNFYQAISPFINNSTSIRVFLYDAFKKDWNKTKDIEVFYILYQILEAQNKSAKEKNPDCMDIFDPLKLIFKDFSFDGFVLTPAKKNIKDGEYNHLALYNEEKNIIIFDDEYLEIAEYIRTMMNQHPKVERAKGKTTKQWILQEDRMKAEQDDKKKCTSTLLPLISSCINHPGFKYKLEELKQVNICQFMDSVNRIQKYEQGTAALHGIYGGMVSAKDIPEDLINFMGDI
nr:MAG TPA_asm: hypothetical protein [Caudoviricetes sp.]